MFEYRTDTILWLRLPLVAEYAYGRGASENVTREVIVNVAEIESAAQGDTVLVNGKYIACTSLNMRSGNTLPIAMSIDELWGNLAGGK